MNDFVTELSQRLPYLEAVLMEIQRFSSLAPFGLMHVALQDTSNYNLQLFFLNI